MTATTLRDAETRWLRAFPGDFWREHEPKLWERLHPIVRADHPLELRLEFWDLKFDLTFRDVDGSCRIHSAPAADRLVRRWARGLAASIQRHILLVYTIAETDGLRRPHVHGVVSLPPTTWIAPEVALDAWIRLAPHCGVRSVIEQYDAQRGAIRYMLNHGGSHPPRIACPRGARCRRGKCMAARFKWSLDETTMFAGRAADRLNTYK